MSVKHSAPVDAHSIFINLILLPTCDLKEIKQNFPAACEGGFFVPFILIVKQLGICNDYQKHLLYL